MKRVLAVAALAFLIGAQVFAGTSTCVLPIADGGGVAPSPPSVEGEIAKATQGQIALKGRRQKPILLGKETEFFTVYGGAVNATELKEGQHVFVWFVGCIEESETPPVAAVIQLCSMAAEQCLK